MYVYIYIYMIAWILFSKTIFLTSSTSSEDARPNLPAKIVLTKFF